LNEQYHKWYSQHLSRDLEMLVFGSAGIPVVLFPTEKGRYFDAKDFGIISSAEEILEERKIKIYCPDSIDGESWYNYDAEPAKRIANHLAYEGSVIKDVIEFAKHETQHERVVLAGISFGGYHALNLAFKYPELASGLITMSGFFDVSRFIFGYDGDDSYFNNPFAYMPNLNDDFYLDKIKDINIVIGIGEQDGSLYENLSMSDLLQRKKINHRLDIRKNCGHDWQYWREMFPEYLSVLL